jgi:hypothetical protein
LKSQINGKNIRELRLQNLLAGFYSIDVTLSSI